MTGVEFGLGVKEPCYFISKHGVVGLHGNCQYRPICSPWPQLDLSILSSMAETINSSIFLTGGRERDYGFWKPRGEERGRDYGNVGKNKTFYKNKYLIFSLKYQEAYNAEQTMLEDLQYLSQQGLTLFIESIPLRCLYTNAGLTQQFCNTHFNSAFSLGYRIYILKNKSKFFNKKN